MTEIILVVMCVCIAVDIYLIQALANTRKYLLKLADSVNEGHILSNKKFAVINEFMNKVVITLQSPQYVMTWREEKPKNKRSKRK